MERKEIKTRNRRILDRLENVITLNIYSKKRRLDNNVILIMF